MRMKKEKLHRLYVVEKLTAPAIAKILGCGRSRVYYWLQKYGIRRRQRQGGHGAGTQSPLWKGCGQLGFGHWNWIRRKARVRKIKIQCSIEDAWKQFTDQNGRCALTGIALSMPIPFAEKAKHNASLDRVDSHKPYKVGNIQWVDKRINLMKNVLPQKEFIKLCRMITKHQS